MKIAFGLLIILISSLGVLAQPNVNGLVGKWQVENKESYEVWAHEGEKLSGYAFKLVDGVERKTETTEISKEGQQWIYTATVPNQNQGRSIPFALNEDEKTLLSFENPKHDFPVKIQYEFKGSDKILVSVLGSDGNGFSYYLDRVE